MVKDLEDLFNEKYAKGLAVRLSKFVGKLLDDSTLAKIDAEVKDHATQLRARGVKFPQVRAIVLPVQGHVELVRADCEFTAVQTHIRNMYAKCPATKKGEMWSAFHHAFPQFTSFLDFDAPPMKFVAA